MTSKPKSTRESRIGRHFERLEKAYAVAAGHGNPKHKDFEPFDMKDFNGEFWKDVEGFRQELQENWALEGSDESLPVLTDFEGAWQLLDDYYGPGFSRTDASSRMTDNPLTALFYYVEMGFYPPPELLLALLERWEIYLAYQGRRPLEEIFLGHPKRKAGNYAQRRGSRNTKLMLEFSFRNLLEEGMTRAQAAETLSEQHGGLSPETILRYMARITDRKKRRR